MTPSVPKLGIHSKRSYLSNYSSLVLETLFICSAVQHSAKPARYFMLLSAGTKVCSAPCTIFLHPIFRECPRYGVAVGLCIAQHWYVTIDSFSVNSSHVFSMFSLCFVRRHFRVCSTQRSRRYVHAYHNAAGSSGMTSSTSNPAVSGTASANASGGVYAQYIRDGRKPADLRDNGRTIDSPCV